MSISLRRLAQLAEVSPSSAWRALHGHGDASPAMRRKILALARKHHFPLPPARATETPNLLNSLCSMVDTEFDETNSAKGFHHRLLSGLNHAARSCGVELLNISSTPEKPETWMSEWPLVVNRQQVDGVVFVLGNELDPHPPFPAPIPTVFLFNGPPQADVVTVANFDGGRRLGARLAELGHRRVAYMGSRSDMSLERLAGLRLALELTQGSVPPEWTDIPPQVGGRELVALRLDQLVMTRRASARGPDGFTALMCYNDYMAAAAVMHLRQNGVRVPEDVSVVGFDNVRPDWYDGPALTTMAVPLEEIGAEAVRLLYWRLAHPDAPPRRLSLTAPLVVGESTRAVGG